MTETQYYILDFYLTKIKSTFKPNNIEYIVDEKENEIKIFIYNERAETFYKLPYIERIQVGSLDFKYRVFFMLSAESKEELDNLSSIYLSYKDIDGTFDDIINKFLTEFETGKPLGLEDKEFKKDDKDKLLYNLLPSKELQQVVEVLTIGAKKYGVDNWKKCDDINRYINALMRHLESYRQGEQFDKEDNLHHLAHLACNALFLLYFENNKDK